MNEQAPQKSALRVFAENLRSAPRRIWQATFRSGTPTTDRSRSLFVFGNVFLHLHSVRTHRWSLRWTTTMGLGIAATAAFLITLITGILLMFYYKPYPEVAYDSIKDIHFVVPTGPLHPQHPPLGRERDGRDRNSAHGPHVLHGRLPAAA